MSDVSGLAEKFLDPEGAIDFAAKMQVIGGAAGDLTDPFKLMYMATNDLEGLMDAIVDTAAASATFNEETGEFGFDFRSVFSFKYISMVISFGSKTVESSMQKGTRLFSLLSHFHKVW